MGFGSSSVARDSVPAAAIRATFCRHRKAPEIKVGSHAKDDEVEVQSQRCQLPWAEAAKIVSQALQQKGDAAQALRADSG